METFPNSESPAKPEFESEGPGPMSEHSVMEQWTLELLPTYALGATCVLFIVGAVLLGLRPPVEPNARLHGWLCLATGSVMLGMALVLKHVRIVQRWAHPIALGLVALIMAHVWARLQLFNDPEIVEKQIILILVIGFVFLSQSWFFGALLLQCLFWVFLVRDYLPLAGQFRSDLVIVIAAVSSTVIHTGRLRLARKLARFQIADAQRQQALKAALDQAQAELRRRHEAERALREADQSKDAFLATFCHELRNPLASIVHAGDLLEDPEHASDHRWARRTMLRQARQLGRMVDDLLDVSRIAQGTIRLETGTRALGALVRAGVDSARPFLDNARQAVMLQVARAPMWIEADAGRMEQIFVNLLVNACKYSEPGRSIFVTARPEADQLVVRIRDQGQGIDPELLPRIFEMFVQGPSRGDQSQTASLGIGLRLVRALTELHGGTVSVHSDGPGCGSEFVLRFPPAPPPKPSDQNPVLYSEPNEPIEPPVETNGSPIEPVAADDDQTTPKLALMIVDDNREMSEAIARLLRRDGHRVVLAATGLDGYNRIVQEHVDIVLIDISLPDIDGLDLAERIRATPSLAEIPLVALSGASVEIEPERLKDAGFVDFLNKPVPSETLRQTISRYAIRACD